MVWCHTAKWCRSGRMHCSQQSRDEATVLQSTALKRCVGAPWAVVCGALKQPPGRPVVMHLPPHHRTPQVPDVGVAWGARTATLEGASSCSMVTRTPLQHSQLHVRHEPTHTAVSSNLGMPSSIISPSSWLRCFTTCIPTICLACLCPTGPTTQGTSMDLPTGCSECCVCVRRQGLPARCLLSPHRKPALVIPGVNSHRALQQAGSGIQITQPLLNQPSHAQEATVGAAAAQRCGDGATCPACITQEHLQLCERLVAQQRPARVCGAHTHAYNAATKTGRLSWRRVRSGCGCAEQPRMDSIRV